jgi:ethanolamine utilization microcompartment shell protein EutL
MKIGESFFIPTLRPAQMMYAADIAAKKARVRVKIYTCEKEGHLGIRVWRTA